MEIGHNKKANNAADDAEEFDFVVRRDAVGEIFGDLTIENNSEAASN